MLLPMTARHPHRCDKICVCPEHGTPLIYAPASDDHACKHGHGGFNPGAALMAKTLRMQSRSYPLG